MPISMIRTAIRQGIRFDYLPTDSRFTNYPLIKFIAGRKIKCHFPGMLKNGTSKYLFNGKLLVLSKILSNLKHSKKMSYNKKPHCRFYEATAELQDVKIKLFFCKTSKHGKWNSLPTTNCELKFEEAYEIYATRWCIEVFFKECKQLLRLGRCESRDFDAQIAAETLEITVKERIWPIIIDITTELRDFFDLDLNMFPEHLFAENEKLIKLLNFKSLVEAA